MMSGERGDLERFAREYQVHYEVQPEFVDAGDAREVVASDVRIFAAHQGERLGTPGCPKCVELTRDLESFAERLVADGELARRAEIVPAEPVLYESPEDRGTDEVSLTLRVRCESPEHRRASGEDPCAREVRDRLAAVGVHRT